MALSTQELIAALPIDLEDETPTSQRALEKLLAGLESKPVPVGRLARFWTVGSMPGRLPRGSRGSCLAKRPCQYLEKLRTAF